jgi:glycosyltransferase involved in cell wall biosynthesis
VLGQNYPNLEYMIMDGGSTDGSVEIIRRYEKQLTHWESKPDGGQAAAINKGFALATGDIVCWLNSDDLYWPGALWEVARQLEDAQGPTIVFGNCLHFKEGNPQYAKGSNVERKAAEQDIRLVDYIIQPSCFWTKETVSMVGPLDEKYFYVFDWEWFIRANNLGVAFKPISKVLSLYRYHDSHKSGTGGDKRIKEIEKIYQHYHHKNHLIALKRAHRLNRIFSRWRPLLRLWKYDRLIYVLFFQFLVSFQVYKSIKYVK